MNTFIPSYFLGLPKEQILVAYIAEFHFHPGVANVFTTSCQVAPQVWVPIVYPILLTA
jgi:hypothetical protein